jgi:hypothetical protein
LGIVIGLLSVAYEYFDVDITGIRLTHFLDGLFKHLFGGSGLVSKTVSSIIAGSIFW